MKIMNGPIAPIPHFDDDTPWGYYQPSRGTKILLSLAHCMPGALKPLTKALRKPIKYHHMDPLDIIAWGIKLRLMPRGNASEQKILTSPKLVDPKEFKVMKEVLRPGSTFIDVGANAGMYSFWAAHCMDGNGKILAVEPDPEMCRRLNYNIRTNSLSCIEICPLAISDYEGKANLNVNPEQRGTNTLERDSCNTSKRQVQISVEALPLLSLLSRASINKVDVLKLDIEGHEPKVLKHFLASAPQNLLPAVVISEFKQDTEDSIVAMMGSRGFNVIERTKLNLIFKI